MNHSELLYALALQQAPNIGPTIAKRLINHCGSAEAVLNEKPNKLLKIDGVGITTIKGLENKLLLEQAEKELVFIDQNNIETFYFTDENYPEALKHCIDGPIVLFQKGHINLKHKRVLSIVGTRKVTTKGIAFCEKLVEELAIYNPVIVSGFAYGTDITAHKGAIKNKLQTVACLAHGLNQIYPKVHQKYVSEMEHNGGFISDFWSTDTFDRNNFLKRNRIIAGLSEATVVIESAEKGGSLVTADIATSYNREVFAVPGRPNDSQSMGCNNLIKFNKAHLLSNPADIPYILNWKLDEDKVAKKRQILQKQLFVELDNDEKKVFNYLKQNEKEMLDVIAINCDIPGYKLAGILLNMELKGVVKPLPGKLFQLV